MTQDFDNPELFPYYNNIDHQYDLWFNNSSQNAQLEYNQRNQPSHSGTAVSTFRGADTTTNSRVRPTSLSAPHPISSPPTQPSITLNFSTTASSDQPFPSSSSPSQPFFSDIDYDDDSAYTLSTLHVSQTLISSPTLISSTLFPPASLQSTPSRRPPLNLPSLPQRHQNSLPTNSGPSSESHQNVLNLSHQFSDLTLDSAPASDIPLPSYNNQPESQFLPTTVPRHFQTQASDNNPANDTIIPNTTISENNPDDLDTHSHNELHLSNTPRFNCHLNAPSDHESVIHNLTNALMPVSQYNLDERFNNGFRIFNSSRHNYPSDDELDDTGDDYSDLNDCDSLDLETGLNQTSDVLLDSSSNNQHSLLGNRAGGLRGSPRRPHATPFPMDNTSRSLLSETTTRSLSLDTTTPSPSSNIIAPSSSLDTTAPSSSEIIHLPPDQPSTVHGPQTQERRHSTSDLEINGEYVRILQARLCTIYDYIPLSFADPVNQWRIRKKYNVIRELIETEAVYIRDMEVVKLIYYQMCTIHPYREYFTHRDIQALFGNIDRIIEASTVLMRKLRCYVPHYISTEVDLGLDIEDLPMILDMDSNIGIVFMEYIPIMEFAYKIYCAHNEFQMKTLYRIEALASPTVDEMFQHCRELSRDVTQAWGLDALLIKPVQRLLKYPLFLQSMIDYTLEKHTDYAPLFQAYNEVKGCANRINDEVEKIRTDEDFPVDSTPRFPPNPPSPQSPPSSSSASISRSLGSTTSSESSSGLFSRTSSGLSGPSDSSALPSSQPSPASFTTSFSGECFQNPLPSFDENKALMKLSNNYEADEDLADLVQQFDLKRAQLKDLIASIRGCISYIQLHFDKTNSLTGSFLNCFEDLDFITDDISSQPPGIDKKYRLYQMFCTPFTTSSSAQVSSNFLKLRIEKHVVAPLRQVLTMFSNISALLMQRVSLHPFYKKFIQFKRRELKHIKAIAYTNADIFMQLQTQLKNQLPVFLELTTKIIGPCLANFLLIQKEWFMQVQASGLKVLNLSNSDIHYSQESDAVVDEFHRATKENNVKKTLSEQVTLCQSNTSTPFVGVEGSPRIRLSFPKLASEAVRANRRNSTLPVEAYGESSKKRQTLPAPLDVMLASNSVALVHRPSQRISAFKKSEKVVMVSSKDFDEKEKAPKRGHRLSISFSNLKIERTNSTAKSEGNGHRKSKSNVFETLPTHAGLFKQSPPSRKNSVITEDGSYSPPCKSSTSEPLLKRSKSRHGSFSSQIKNICFK